MKDKRLNEKPLILMAFNAVAMALCVKLQNAGINVAYIFDNNKKLHGKKFREVLITGVNPELMKNANIVICSYMCEVPISKQLSALLKVIRAELQPAIMPYNDIVSRSDLPDMLSAIQDVNRTQELYNISEFHSNVIKGSGDLSIMAALPPQNDFDDSLIIPLTSINVTERCTLKCKECIAFVPFFENPKTYSYKTIVSSFTKLINSISFLRCATFVGGEPLLHPNITDIIEFVCSSDKVGYTNMPTNCTVLPSEDFFTRVAKFDNFLIRVSNYGKLSRKKDEIIEMCEKFSVRYSVLENMTWYGRNDIIDFDDDYDATCERFAVCASQGSSLLGNHFSKCASSLLFHSLSAVPSNAKGIKSYLDLNDSDFSPELLRKYMESNEPLQACSVCSGKSRTREQVAPTEQAEKLIAYTKYE